MSNENTSAISMKDIFGDAFEEEVLVVADKSLDKEPDVTKDSVAKTDEPTKNEQCLVLRGDNYPKEFLSMVEDIRRCYSNLPNINYSKMYSELSDLAVPSCPTPTLQILNDEIQKVQAAKDRLAEIMIDVIKASAFKKRAVDILESAWSKYSNEGSADKRKGDTAFRMSAFSLDYAEIESLYRACLHILKNLDSLHDSLSRRITIIQLQLKLNDTGRGALPDFSFSGSRADDFLDSSPIANIDEKEKSDINDDAIPASSKSF